MPQINEELAGCGSSFAFDMCIISAIFQGEVITAKFGK